RGRRQDVVDDEARGRRSGEDDRPRKLRLGSGAPERRQAGSRPAIELMRSVQTTFCGLEGARSAHLKRTGLGVLVVGAAMLGVPGGSAQDRPAGSGGALPMPRL